MKYELKEKDNKPIISMFYMNPHAPYNEIEVHLEIKYCYKSTSKDNEYNIFAILNKNDVPFPFEKDVYTGFDITENELNNCKILKEFYENNFKKIDTLQDENNKAEKIGKYCNCYEHLNKKYADEKIVENLDKTFTCPNCGKEYGLDEQTIDDDKYCYEFIDEDNNFLG